MASNFDFLKNIDNELYETIEDAQKLFRDEYFNQAVIQLRIFAEKMAKNIYGASVKDMTFDDILNALKDKARNEREKEFVEDLFFIKKQGNKCAHGETIGVSETLDTIRRAFEASINYAAAKKYSKKVDKLVFDETLLITQKPNKEEKLVEKYLKRAQREPELFDKYSEEEIKPKKKPKKETNPKQEIIKEKIKKAKKNLKTTVNKKEKKRNKSQKKQNPEILKHIVFVLFCAMALIVLTKMLFLW